MITDTDVGRMLQSLLREPTPTPTRGLHRALAEVATTPQQRRRWLHRPGRVFTGRTSNGSVAAAAIALALVGGSLFLAHAFDRAAVTVPGPETDGSPPATGSAADGTIAPAAIVFPRPGPLPSGTYGAIVDGVSFTFNLPQNGWESSLEQPGVLRADSYGDDDGEYRGSAWIGFQTVDNVYADPCLGVPMSPPIGPTMAELVDALAAMPGIVASTPRDIRGVTWPARYIQLTVSDGAKCRGDGLSLWYGSEEDVLSTSRRLRAEDSRIDVLVADVGGQRFVIDRERTPGDRSVSLHTITTVQFRDLSADELEYVNRVLEICTTAGDRFGSDPHVVGGFRSFAPEFATLADASMHADRASMISDAAFQALDALEIPASLRAEAADLQGPLESAIERLRQVPAAARAGDAEGVSKLMTEAYMLSNALWEHGGQPWDPRDDRLLLPSFSGCVLPSGGG